MCRMVAALQQQQHLADRRAGLKAAAQSRWRLVSFIIQENRRRGWELLAHKAGQHYRRWPDLKRQPPGEGSGEYGHKINKQEEEREWTGGAACALLPLQAFCCRKLQLELKAVTVTHCLGSRSTSLPHIHTVHTHGKRASRPHSLCQHDGIKTPMVGSMAGTYLNQDHTSEMTKEIS